MDNQLFDRDLSWLAFNHRVLQEAAAPEVPLFERIKFLAIYSSNLDEFFRVRVAALRSFRALEKDTRREMSVKPRKTLRQIRHIVHRQQEEFGRIFRTEILPALNTLGIHLLSETSLNEAQQVFARVFFEKEVAPHLEVVSFPKNGPMPFLENKALYLLIDQGKPEAPIEMVKIPTEQCPRFVALPCVEGHEYIFLDDIVRFNLRDWLGQSIEGAYSIKLSRNAELPIDDEYSGDLVEKIKQGLAERHVGPPTRLLYDSAIPEPLRSQLKTSLELNKNDLIPGARYHNFNDFFGFPNPTDDASLQFPLMPPLTHPRLENAASLLAEAAEADIVLHYPYQTFNYVIRLLEEAAADPLVTQIKITLYRAASPSAIVGALEKACAQEKEVTVFIEAKARFDEAANLQWGERLKAAGAQVFYSYPGIKVHAKLLLICRREGEKLRNYVYLSTGNFNEKTAKIYADHALLSADKRLANDTARLFELLERKRLLPDCKHLLPAPFVLRDQLKTLIDEEIAIARTGRPAHILLKINSLEEPDMIAKLYEASQAGVRIQLIVRGICCLLPGIAGLSENIEAISIVDRFLEHVRVFIFGNDGQEKMYIASADWMKRNLHRRIEVAIPIYDPEVFRQIRHIIDLQWRDNTKARWINETQDNPIRSPKPGESQFNAQSDIYTFCKELL